MDVEYARTEVGMEALPLLIHDSHVIRQAYQFKVELNIAVLLKPCFGQAFLSGGNPRDFRVDERPCLPQLLMQKSDQGARLC